MVRVATYNIHCGVGTDGQYDLNRIVNVLRSCKADVVCLQEVEVNRVRRRARHFSAEHADDQISLLAQKLDYPYFHFQPTFKTYAVSDPNACEYAGLPNYKGEVLVKDPDGNSAWGNGILSKYPFETFELLHFQSQRAALSENHLFPDAEEQPRGAVAALVKVAGESGPTEVRVWVACTHLSSWPSSPEQRRQATELVDWADGLVDPRAWDDAPKSDGCFLCGDMNAFTFQPWSAYTTIKSRHGWNDVWSKKGSFLNSGTVLGPLKWLGLKLRIDHIFFRSERFRCQATGVQGREPGAHVASDHLPVWADFSIS